MSDNLYKEALHRVALMFMDPSLSRQTRWFKSKKSDHLGWYNLYYTNYRSIFNDDSQILNYWNGFSRELLRIGIDIEEISDFIKNLDISEIYKDTNQMRIEFKRKGDEKVTVYINVQENFKIDIYLK